MEPQPASFLAAVSNLLVRVLRSRSTPVHVHWPVCAQYVQTGLVRMCAVYFFVPFVEDTRRSGGLGHVLGYCHPRNRAFIEHAFV